MYKKLGKKAKLKIAGATMASIFCLAACFSGTYAWFVANKSLTTTTGQFQVTNTSISLGAIKLCKFNYYAEGEFVDYLHPAKGEVDVFNYNPKEGHERFEDESGNPQKMNLFDPITLQIEHDKTLRDLYCNAVYIVTLNSASIDNAELKVYANHISDKEKTKESDIFLTDCVDFDVYSQGDLDAITTKVYYPNHIEDREEVDLEGYDEIFYKIDYLSSLSTHACFYNDNPKQSQIAIHDIDNLKTVTFVDGVATFYLNVNYSLSQLTKYSHSLATSNINAIFDYYFSIEM